MGNPRRPVLCGHLHFIAPITPENPGHMRPYCHFRTKWGPWGDRARGTLRRQLCVAILISSPPVPVRRQVCCSHIGVSPRWGPRAGRAYVAIFIDLHLIPPRSPAYVALSLPPHDGERGKKGLMQPYGYLPTMGTSRRQGLFSHVQFFPSYSFFFPSCTPDNEGFM